jgi:MFS family permease
VKRVEDIGFYAGFVGKNFPSDLTAFSPKSFLKRILTFLCISMAYIFFIFAGASLMLGRALTSTFWGMVADRIGRKPVIVFGIFTTSVFFIHIILNKSSCSEES